MNVATTARSPRSALGGVKSAEIHEVQEVVIGKDILELVSSAMYVDAMTIYREYVQNAADSIDAARVKGVLALNEPGRVEISIDPTSRTVTIRDNGGGIAFPQFARKLTALGASTKRGTLARGFRGVGRLGGLGYAQEVVFRSRVDGEKKVSQMRWDCRHLRAAFREIDEASDVADLIRKIVTVERYEDSGAPARFFEVELKGVVRLRNDRLLSATAISDYLAQVAPVPFAPDFKFGEQVTAALRDRVNLGLLEIRVDGAVEPLYRPHRDRIICENKLTIAFQCVEIVEVPSIDGATAAIGWIAHHDYEGALPNGALVKGIRLRSGNIQIGDSTLLEELFPETRFNSWAVGEIHVLDRKIIPNGRRDHFEQNAHYHNLLNHLAPTARDIARRCRTSSVQRKWAREFDLLARSAKETIDIIKQGSVSRAERERLALAAEQTFLQMSKVSSMDVLTEGRDERKKMTDKLKGKLASAMSESHSDSSLLMRLPKARRKTYEQFFELIYQCSANKVAAKALIDRILMKIQ